MLEVFNFIVGIVFLIGAGAFACMSSLLVSEKKARYRAGTHDYYDNPIKETDEK
jgi:hypothetical protein